MSDGGFYVSLPDLSLTEQRIASLAAAGVPASEIATSLELDARTVEWHLSRARQKLERAAVLRDRLIKEERKHDA